VALEVVHSLLYLKATFVTRGSGVRGAKLGGRHPSACERPILLEFLGRQALELNPPGDRLPLEVKHGVDSRDFYPPVSPFHRLFNQPRVVAGHHNVLVAVFNICI